MWGSHVCWRGLTRYGVQNRGSPSISLDDSHVLSASHVWLCAMLLVDRGKGQATPGRLRHLPFLRHVWRLARGSAI